MRISDWSSDVCSSDLHHAGPRPGTGPDAAAGGTGAVAAGSADLGPADAGGGGIPGGRRAHLGGYAHLADAGLLRADRTGAGDAEGVSTAGRLARRHAGSAVRRGEAVTAGAGGGRARPARRRAQGGALTEG